MFSSNSRGLTSCWDFNKLAMSDRGDSWTIASFGVLLAEYESDRIQVILTHVFGGRYWWWRLMDRKDAIELINGGLFRNEGWGTSPTVPTCDTTLCVIGLARYNTNNCYIHLKYWAVSQLLALTSPSLGWAAIAAQPHKCNVCQKWQCKFVT